MNMTSLTAEREHLANLLEATQRCKVVDLFESLAAFNERFAKLQDTLGAAMRHGALLMRDRKSVV